MIKSILVATDASPAATNAVELAADMAFRYSAALNLLYVARDLKIPPELKESAEVAQLIGPRKAVFELVGKRILADASRHAESKGARRIHTAIAEGDPAVQIINHAKARGVDLIVMGTRGLGQMRSMLLGSVSRKVINSTDISCLIVRE